MTTLNREEIIDKQTTAVYQMALRKHNITLEADFLEDLLQTALDTLLEIVPKFQADRSITDNFGNCYGVTPSHKENAGHYKQLLSLKRE